MDNSKIMMMMMIIDDQNHVSETIGKNREQRNDERGYSVDVYDVVACLRIFVGQCVPYGFGCDQRRICFQFGLHTFNSNVSKMCLYISYSSRKLLTKHGIAPTCFSAIFDLTYAGLINETETSNRLSSIRIASLRASSANLLAAYVPFIGTAMDPATDPMLTIRDPRCCFSIGKKACVTSTKPNTFTSKTLRMFSKR